MGSSVNYFMNNIIAEIFSAWEKAECYEKLANHSQRICTLIQNNIFFFLTFMTEYIDKSKFYYFEWM